MPPQPRRTPAKTTKPAKAAKATRPPGRVRELVAAAARYVERRFRQKAVDQSWQEQAWCVDTDTEILTVDGWRRHDQISPGTLVLTLDPESGTSGWEPVEHVARFDVFDTPMLSIETQQHSSLTTMNHRWPTIHTKFDPDGRRTGAKAPRWVTSQTMTFGVDAIRSAAPCRDLPAEAKYADAFVELVAWFWTEGSIRRDRTRPSVTISQSQEVNPAYTARIRAALTTLYGPPPDHTRQGRVAGPPTWREGLNPNNGCVTFTLSVAAAEPLLTAAPDKVIATDFLRSLTSAQLGLFIDTSVSADGYTVGGRYRTTLLTQKCPRRLAAFELACILAGKTVACRYMPNRTRDGTTTERWGVTTRDTATVSTDGRRASTVAYTGTVWCPVTPSQTWLARRNGTVYFTGNTLYDCTPEVRFASAWVSNAMSRGRLYAGRRAADGTVDPAPDGHPAAELVASIAGGPAGQSQLLSDFGTHLAVAGEGWIVVRPDLDRAGQIVGEKWHVLSVLELKERGGRLEAEIDGDPWIIPAYDPDAPADPYTPVAIRVWDPHPRRHIEADSPIRSSLPLLEQLRMLDAAITAIARSRLTGRGVLLVPQGTRFPVSPTQQGAEDDLLEVFMTVAETAYKDPDSAAAAVPIILEVPAEAIGQIQRITFESNFDELAVKLREELIKRFAMGLDTPVEILLGMSSASHWGQWSIAEEAIRLAVEPRLATVADALTTQWLRPMLQDRQLEDADDWLVWYDTSALRVRSNRGQTALEVFDRGAISAEALRRETGFDETDAPGAGEPVPQPRAAPELPVDETPRPPQTQDNPAPELAEVAT